VRVHAAELGKAAHASEAKLAKGVSPDARALAALAGRVARNLDRLSHSDSDRAEQRRLATALERGAARAEELGAKL
jgi:hypothetical protein